MPSAVLALLLAVAVLVGLGIGRGVWTSSRSASVFTPGGSGAGGGSGANLNPFGGSGNPGSGAVGGGSSPASSGPEATVAGELVDINVTLSYEQEEAEGTGIVLNSTGLVLTNNHVISGSTSLSVVDIGNGKTYGATVLGYDRTQDVALVQMQGASGLATATIGNSAGLAVGQSVVGIGNAGGVGGTPSAAPGQITALGQSISAQDQSTGTTEQLSGLIQTNCDIQPGDSGGPLINRAGAVVGMDTAASVGFSFQTAGNQGYAIPIDQAMQIARQIESRQSSSTVHVGPTAFLGVEVRPSSAVNGALVSGVIQGGPAQGAGLAANDVITGLGGAAVASPEDLTNLISQDRPGQQVQVTWTDPQGNTHSAMVTLASGPPQ